MSDSKLRANLNFAIEKDQEGAFEFPYVTREPSGETLHLKTYPIDLHDLRKEAAVPTLDVEGFTWQTVPYSGLDSGMEGWEKKYAEDTCAWLKQYMGVKECRPINSVVRRRMPEGGNEEANFNFELAKTQSIQPVSAAHVDVTEERGIYRVKSQFEDLTSEELAKERIAMINTWRPLRGPVIDAPLALCDSRTLDPKDMLQTTDIYGGGYFIQHNNNMRWLYLRNQSADEILVFRQYDSDIKQGDAGSWVPHTSFIDAEREHEGLPRHSIEVRCAIIY